MATPPVDPLPGITRADTIRTCPCCGLAQRVPYVGPTEEANCARCESRLLQPVAKTRSHSRTAAIAMAALFIYPLAITLPIMKLEQLGTRSEASILDGTATLLQDGHLFVGLIVLLCSVILPMAKLLGLLILSSGHLLLHMRQRAWAYRFIEWTGRWGMLDILAVAVLVAAVKLGSSVELSAGPGAAAFATVVILSLIASAVFDPHALWESEADSSMLRKAMVHE